MSLLIAAPDTLAGAAADVASIGLSLRAAHAAAAVAQVQSMPGVARQAGE